MPRSNTAHPSRDTPSPPSPTNSGTPGPADDCVRRDGVASPDAAAISSAATPAAEEDERSGDSLLSDSVRRSPGVDRGAGSSSRSSASNLSGSPPLLNGAETARGSPQRGGSSQSGSSPFKVSAEGSSGRGEHDDAVVPCMGTAIVRRRPDAAPSPATSSSAAEDDTMGGKLRFYLAGSCVLELRHDLDVTGRPKQWVQSWGKTYHPPAVLPTSSSVNNAPWLPKELKETPSLEESQADKISSQTITPSFEAVKIKKKPLSGNYMISYMRRLRHSSPLQRKVLPSCLARKVARCPQHILNGVGSGGDLLCQHGNGMTGCLERRPQKKRPSSTFLEKSRNVAAIIEELTGRGGAVERPAKRPSSGSGTVAATTSSAVTTNPTSPDGRGTTSTTRDAGGGGEVGDEVPEDTKVRPLPEWYFDPNKASIPITEMIGYPRPSLQPSPGSGGLQHPPPNPSPKKRSIHDDSDRFGSGYSGGTSAAPPTPPPSTTKRPRERHSASPPTVPPELRFGGRCEPGSSEHVSSLLQAAGLAMAGGGGGAVGGSPDASAVAKMLTLLQEGAAERAAVLARIEALGCSPEAALQSLAFDEERLGADGLGCLKKKRKGGGYGRGRTIGEAVRAFVIGDILNLGGDVRTKYVPRGVFTEVASRYKIDATTTYRWWLKYCNGVRMASANAGHAESSHKSYLPINSTVGAGGSLANLVTKTEPKKRGDSVSPHERTQPVKRSGSSSHHRPEPNDHFRGPATDDNHHPHHNHNHHHHQAKEHGRPSHSGGSHSPRSDDSASSGASLVDPAALYASSLALFPPPNGGAWPQNLPMPTLTNGQLPLNPGSSLPLPVGVCLPYLWNYSALPAYVNGGLHAGQAMPGVSGIKTEAPSTSAVDEPLDLTVPKKATPNRSMAKMEIGLRRGDVVLSDSKMPAMSQTPNFNPFMYRECQPDELILRTLLTVQEQQAVNSASLFRIESRHVAGKKNAKGTTNANGITHRNMKPKHYPFTSLQIGTFELHSKVPNEYISEREIFKENPNKFKVIFTQRKFVYEFETNSVMDPTHEAQQKEHPHSRRMACIVVPFSIVEAFWCYGSTIILRVISKPFMFLGQRLKQVGCVPSLTVYETKKSVDLTGGQLSQSHLHKVTLLKPHLVEQLKIYLVLFDVRFRNLMAPSIFPVLRLAAEQNNPAAKEVATTCS